MPVAMTSTSGAVYQARIFTSSAPCSAAPAVENSRSVPTAILSLYFFASATVRGVPATTCCNRATLAGASAGAASASASTNGWKLSQMPFLAISSAVASSISWPCSITLTPAPIARWMATGVYACTVT